MEDQSPIGFINYEIILRPLWFGPTYGPLDLRLSLFFFFFYNLMTFFLNLKRVQECIYDTSAGIDRMCVVNDSDLKFPSPQLNNDF